MDENVKLQTPTDDVTIVPESPKPLAFTIEFGASKSVDNERHKALVEKLQLRHRRGQSLSKIEDSPVSSTSKKHPSTGNLPRKSNLQSEGYFSSDEKGDRCKNVRSANMRLRAELTLPLKNINSNKMSQSFPNGNFNHLGTIKSPELELKDISSPEMDFLSPFSSKNPTPSPVVDKRLLLGQLVSPDVENRNGLDSNKFFDGLEFDFDKSDTPSDAGTYTLDTENYSEEQKARMSIDKEFNIEQISVMKKTEEYIRSLENIRDTANKTLLPRAQSAGHVRVRETICAKTKEVPKKEAASPNIPQPQLIPQKPVLSPILSPTQNLSIADNNLLDKILCPSTRGKKTVSATDEGCFTSVTSSGAFSRRNDTKSRGHVRQPSLTKSEVQIQTYVDSKQSNGVINAAQAETQTQEGVEAFLEKVANLPPSGKASPTKIPSPVHSALSRPRSRNSVSSLNVDLSDSSLETESFLKPTQNYINTLQKRLSLDNSDHESDYENILCNNLRLNNETQNLTKQRSMHVRHNSFDDKSAKISNKLEHFKSKNLQGIDQTYTNKLNQYMQTKVHKIQNSPNNSPIRRSSSFSNKNQFINVQHKFTNLNSSTISKDINIRNSPNLDRNGSIQRSASTASIKPTLLYLRRSSINSEHTKIDRNQFADTESSSEDDFEKNLQKKKDFSNLTTTRYNRAFSLRRARLETDQHQPRCPNTPEMRRKFQPPEQRAISMDRRPVKANEVSSRYLQNVTKNKNLEKIEVAKNVPKIGSTLVKSTPGKTQVFSRTDSGRFSVRTSKPQPSSAQKGSRKDSGSKKQSGGRSNSSLSSREMEFQNWKRRKSYDPMKAAAEGKKKAELAKKQNCNTTMTQSYTESNQSQDCDSSPSHSSSVHRSQSFHGTAALEQLLSSEEDDDLTLSADEGFSPPTPSPCKLSPARAKLRHAWRDRILH